ncbi:MAG TPA: class A beta-lactamase [Phenylobacterium sp.]
MAIRRLLIALPLLMLAACGPRHSGDGPTIDADKLSARIGKIAIDAAPARLGIGFIDLQDAEAWTLAADQRFPMHSVVKLVLAAAVLAEVDAGKLSLDEVIPIQDEDLSPQTSPVAAAWPGKQAYTVRELLTAAVAQSDNTASDVLMKRIGGPGAVTAWLNAKHVSGVRVDRYAREIHMESLGMPSFRPEWKDAVPFDTVTTAQRREALARYVADPRDTATPHGMIDFFVGLDSGELLSPASRQLLMDILAQSRNAPGRIAAGLPKGATLAHKAGTARGDIGLCPVVNDVGVAKLRGGERYAIAVFMAGGQGELDRCEKVVAAVTRELIRAAR